MEEEKQKPSYLPQGTRSYKRNAMCMHIMLHQVEVPRTIREDADKKTVTMQLQMEIYAQNSNGTNR